MKIDTGDSRKDNSGGSSYLECLYLYGNVQFNRNVIVIWLFEKSS